MNRNFSLLLTGLLVLSASQALADEAFNGKVSLRGSEVRVSPGQGQSNTTLTISGPDGFYTSAFSAHGSLSIDLIQTGATAEGSYNYQVTTATSQKASNKNAMNNGRGDADKKASFVPASTSGSFYAKGGLIKEFAAGSEKN